jgi:DNA-directed RNA polymerase subunit M/transcription elongation factor TFIIS
MKIIIKKLLFLNMLRTESLKQNFDKTIKKLGYDNIELEAQEKMSEDDIFYMYYDNLARVKDDEDIDDIINDNKNGLKNFETKTFEEYNIQRDLKDHQIENPPKMRDGIVKCPKCNKKKTIVVEFQGRSCDEGFTYELHCYNKKCKLEKTRDFMME